MGMRDLVIDGDGHVIEPIDLWEKNLPEPMRSRGLIVNREDPHWNTLSGVELPPRDKYVGREKFNKMGELLEADRYRTAVEQKFSASSTLANMDLEGVDVSVLFPS